MVKAIGFDLDDTLCDYEKSARISRMKMFDCAVSKCNGLKLSQFRKAYDKTLENIINEYEGAAIFLRMSGEETRLELISRALRACGFYDPRLAEDLVKTYGRERRKTLKLFPNALCVLSSLRRKYSLSLVTNGPSDIQREEIEDLRIAGYFDHIIIAGEVGYAKPDPRIFNLLIAKYAIPPSQILYVGNSQEEDVMCAFKAGLKVAWLNRKGEKMKKEIPNPHYEIKSLSKLLDALL
jgi:putative hydrolase of the HAD superfamily